MNKDSIIDSIQNYKQSFELMFDNLKTSIPDVSNLKEVRKGERNINNFLKNNLYKPPNFICIGAQKSGTTWLHENLGKHPDIFLPYKRKELIYFDEK